MMAIITKGKYSELRIGTSNMLCDMNNMNDEFKFWFNVNEVIINPFEDHTVPLSQVSVDIYM